MNNLLTSKIIIMKHLVLLFALALVVVSCQKDEELNFTTDQNETKNESVEVRGPDLCPAGTVNILKVNEGFVNCGFDCQSPPPPTCENICSTPFTLCWDQTFDINYPCVNEQDLHDWAASFVGFLDCDAAHTDACAHITQSWFDGCANAMEYCVEGFATACVIETPTEPDPGNCDDYGFVFEWEDCYLNFSVPGPGNLNVLINGQVVGQTNQSISIYSGTYNSIEITISGDGLDCDIAELSPPC